MEKQDKEVTIQHDSSSSLVLWGPRPFRRNQKLYGMDELDRGVYSTLIFASTHQQNVCQGGDSAKHIEAGHHHPQTVQRGCTGVSNQVHAQDGEGKGSDL